MASTYLSKTLGTATNSKIWTFSTWLKRSGLSSTQHIFSIDNGSNRDAFSFDSDNGLRFYLNDSAAGNADLSTNRILRDISAFYHLVLTVDTTQATQENRIKLFINGTQYSWDETVIWTNTLNANTFNASGNTFRIGRDRTAANYFDGVLTHTHFTDGYAYDASTFGETDATTGIWKAKVSPSVTYGTNGFFLKFENSGSMGLDSSGNANNFTVNGTLTQTIDTPTNVFATFNLLWRARVNNIDLPTYMSNGNTTFNSQGSDARLAYFASTLGVTSGKYYWEVKSESGSGGAVGISYDSMQSNSNAQFWDNANLLGCAIKIDGNVFNGKSGDGSTALGVSYTEDDIYGFALDMDNYALYAHINGTYVNSGDPTSGASRTGSLLNLLTSGLAYLNSGEPVFPFFADLSAGSHAELKVNFGNGYFGTTAVASAGLNGNGSIFEFNVPTGYYALNTKNINTYG